MNDQKEEAKIAKYAEKKKSGPIIKIMEKADSEVLIEALKALGGIADEDSANKITPLSGSSGCKGQSSSLSGSACN